MVLITLLVIGLVNGVPCTEDLMGHGFSECALNNTRTAYYYWNTTCEETDLHLLDPVYDLDCSHYCPAGQVLDLDPHHKTSTCTPCPPNTYNIGGGIRISGEEDDWRDSMGKFQTWCWTADWLTWHEGQNCTAWTTVGTGSGAKSGEASKNGWVES